MDAQMENKLESNEPSTTSNDDTNEAGENNQNKYIYKPVKTKSFVNKTAYGVKIDYKSLTHEQLVNEAEKMEKHIFQLRNLLIKAGCGESQTNNPNRKPYRERPFDFNKFNKRHVLLKFAYVGWDYQGYIIQEGTIQTVEHYLFQALVRTKLIESRETSNYHRCGRTDKGVSAFGQVISIDLRSICASGKGVIINPNSTVTNTDIDKELNYVKQLNGALPENIRVYAWAPVETSEFSARFDCVKRTYRYYVPKGDLDIESMRYAGKKLIGERDFRNFCKMDVSNGVVTFFRRIDDVTINVRDKEPNLYSTVEIIIEGSSFLWHQIRCVVAVLLLIGQKKEEPSIIDDLLNIEKYPCKPEYSMCSETPLILFDCVYNDAEWRYDQPELEKVIKSLQDNWLNHQTKSNVIKSMIDSLETNLTKKPVPEISQTPVTTNQRNVCQPYTPLQGKSLSASYTKFADRRKALSLDARVDHYVKKRRLNPGVYEKLNENKKIAQMNDIYKPRDIEGDIKYSNSNIEEPDSQE